MMHTAKYVFANTVANYAIYKNESMLVQFTEKHVTNYTFINYPAKEGGEIPVSMIQ